MTAPRFDLARQVAALGADSLLPPERSRKRNEGDAMNAKTLTKEESLDRLRAAIGNQYGDKARFAARIGVSKAMVSLVLHGKKPMYGKVAAAIGVKLIKGQIVENIICGNPVDSHAQR